MKSQHNFNPLVLENRRKWIWPCFSMLLGLVLCCQLMGCNRGESTELQSPDENPLLAELPDEEAGISNSSQSLGAVEVLREKYQDGTPKSERHVRKDVHGKITRHGKEIRWYANAQKSLEGEFRDGKKVGTWSEWNEDGSLKYEGAYIDDKKQGKWITHPNAELKVEEDFRQGEIFSRRTFRKNESGQYAIRDGEWSEWYEAGKKKTERRYANDKEHGLWREWHANGQLLEERNYDQGKPNGAWISWHPDGRERSHQEFQNGNPHGEWTSWHENGNVHEKGKFQDSKKHGLWISYLPDGQKSRELHYQNGVLEGPAQEWYVGNQLWYEGLYRQGEKDGEWVTWYKSDPPQRKSIEHYKLGKRMGDWQRWHVNGQLQTEEHYEDDAPVGHWTTWYESGQKKAETHWENGVFHGIHTRWDANGKRIAAEKYDQGRLVEILYAPPIVLNSTPPAAPKPPAKTP